MMTDREEFEKWWKENSTKIVKDYGFGSFSENVVFSAWQARGELDAVRIKELEEEHNNLKIEYSDVRDSYILYKDKCAELKAKLDKAKEALKCIDEDLVNPVHYILVKEALEELDK